MCEKKQIRRYFTALYLFLLLMYTNSHIGSLCFFHVMPVTPPLHHLFRILVKYLPHIFFPALFLYIRCCLLHLRRSVLFIVCIGSDAVYQFFVQKCSYEFLNLSSCAASDAVCVDLYVHAHIVEFSYSLL